MKYLYRFIPLETFINMVQSQALTFVLPSLWEDPYEFNAFDLFLKKELEKDSSEILLFALFALKFRTFAQSWTKLPESDALWRIYGNKEKTCIRVKVAIEKIEQLNEVTVHEVKYTDNFQKVVNNQNDKILGTYLAIKRMAFAHEKEVRLVKNSLFDPNNDEEFQDRIIGSGLAVSSDFRDRFTKDNKLTLEEFKERLDKLFKISNSTSQQKFDVVSFAHIPNFIASVMLSPFTNEWVCDTISEFCKKK